MRLSSSFYSEIKAQSLFGRYITNTHIEPLFESLAPSILKSEIGHSVKGLPLYRFRFGKGKTRIMMWSQMHGNETTTTKSIFDFLNLIGIDSFYLDNFSFSIIPILNPDGAKAYTRLNANNIDLNRDAKLLSQPESQALFNEFHEFSPDFCLNLHGQRTIYSVGAKGKSSVLSFLAPAHDKIRSISPNRLKAMTLIGAIYKDLNKELKNGISLYDDAFNSNCTGDTFQALGVPTILFEAGHYPGDYQREETRRYMLEALLSVFHAIHSKIKDDSVLYSQIPSNDKSYFDVIIRNSQLSDKSLVDIGITFNEKLAGDAIEFIPQVEKIEVLNDYVGHKEVDANLQPVFSPENLPLKVGDEIDFVLVKNEKILIKP